MGFVFIFNEVQDKNIKWAQNTWSTQFLSKKQDLSGLTNP